MDTVIDIDHLRTWIGKTQTVAEVVTVHQAAQLAATLDHERFPQAGEPLPLTFHWVNVFPPQRASLLGEDGHPRRGGFLPPVALPRRMWAGSSLVFGKPLLVGENLERTSTIKDVTLKQGSTGALVFVSVEYRLDGAGGGSVVENQDVVFRDQPREDESPAAPAPGTAVPTGGEWKEEHTPDAVLLFRYNACIFNAHRIHFDRPYATRVEKYPALVVPGPLTATMLLEALARRDRRVVRSFSFRNVRPLFEGRVASLAGKASAGDAAELWAADDDGFTAMRASVTFAPG